jgi:hypothetical protein
MYQVGCWVQALRVNRYPQLGNIEYYVYLEPGYRVLYAYVQGTCRYRHQSTLAWRLVSRCNDMHLSVPAVRSLYPGVNIIRASRLKTKFEGYRESSSMEHVRTYTCSFRLWTNEPFSNLGARQRPGYHGSCTSTAPIFMLDHSR